MSASYANQQLMSGQPGRPITDDDRPQGRELAAMPGSAGSFPARQDALDWQVFAAAFEKRNGFVPHPMDTGHKEYFHWFTVGAHEEFMGRLTVKPNELVLAARLETTDTADQ